jgi:hypothetical protein
MALHWWHTDRLRAELANGSLSEPDSLKYMLLAAFLYVEAGYVNVWFGSYRDWGYLFEALLVLTISLVGTHECYKANGGSLGQAFLQRMAAIAVPVGLKVAIFATLVSQAVYFGFAYVVTPSTFRDPAFVYRFISFVLPPVWAFVYYWRIAHHLGQLPRTNEGAT